MDQQNNQLNTFFIVLAIVAGALIIGGAIYFKGSSSFPKQPSEEPSITETKINALGKFVLGNPNAPLTMIEFADFQCPFCGKFYKETEGQIIDKYVKSGQLKIEYRDFAFLGEESVNAAQAASCAADQNKFWQFHNYLYDHQNGENEGAFSIDNLKKFASSIGLDTAKFNQCLDSDKYKAAIESSTSQARDLGVQSTPTILIGRLPMTVKKSSSGNISSVDNGTFVLGAYPFDTFDKAINGLLK